MVAELSSSTSCDLDLYPASCPIRASKRKDRNMARPPHVATTATHSRRVRTRRGVASRRGARGLRARLINKKYKKKGNLLSYCNIPYVNQITV